MIILMMFPTTLLWLFVLYQTTDSFTLSVQRCSPARYIQNIDVSDNVLLRATTASEDEISASGTATTDGSSFLSNNDGSEEYLKDILKPPPELQDLIVGETIHLLETPVEITRVASKPDMFVVRNLIPLEDQQELLNHEEDLDFEDASTKSGFTTHRSKSSVAWVSPNMSPTAGFLQSLCTQVFLHPRILEKVDKKEGYQLQYTPEPLQIARYDRDGRFDIHHDGGGRIVTILSYLNGVAGTWFPFAKVYHEENAIDDEGPPKISLDSRMTEGMVPGRDGIWVVGNEEVGNIYDNDNNLHMLRIEAGDAIVFYNYEYDEEYQGPLMCWRSLHAGMPAKEEKWIATNWIDSEHLMMNQQKRNLLTTTS